MKSYYLTLDEGSGPNTVYPLVATTTIGRSSNNTIALTDSAVSRYHAKVVFLEGTWIVEDLGSINGIVMDAKRVERVVLEPGDIFHIGRTAFTLIEHETSGGRDQLLETIEILIASLDELEILVNEGQDDSWSQRIQDAIAAIPFFSALDKDEQKGLTETATLHGFSTGEIIVREGDPGRSIYVVLNGRVRVFTRDYHGEELEFAILGISDFFGEMSFLTGKPRSSNVAALETSALMELSYSSMRRLIQKNTAIKEVLLEHHHDRLKKIREERAEHDMQKRGHDLRSKERLPVNVVVCHETSKAGEANPSILQALAVDVSLSGMVVAMAESSPGAMHPAGQVRLEVELPQPWGVLPILGYVSWVKASGTRKKVILVGVSFEGLSESNAIKLNEYLHGENHPEV